MGGHSGPRRRPGWTPGGKLVLIVLAIALVFAWLAFGYSFTVHVIGNLQGDSDRWQDRARQMAVEYLRAELTARGLPVGDVQDVGGSLSAWPPGAFEVRFQVNGRYFTVVHEGSFLVWVGGRGTIRIEER